MQQPEHRPKNAPYGQPLETLTLRLADAQATAALGASLADMVEAGMRIYLSGSLGAGKTTLARGLLRALGATGRIKSPTFALVEPYNLPRFDVYHFDFYRFSSPDEWMDAGFDEIFASGAVCLVEWPELAAPYLPAPDLELGLELLEAHADTAARNADQGNADSEAGRVAQLAAFSPRGCACLKRAREARGVAR